MKGSLARFSAQFSRLSSAERWFIILVIIVVFAVVNFVFIFPHFGEFGRLSRLIGDARAKQQRYEEAIAQTEALARQVAQLEGTGAAVPQEDQVNNFLTAIQNQAVQSGVTIVANTPQPQRTNQFFLERVQSLRTQSNEEQLVDFLYSLGAGNSMIRVRALSVQPDVPHYALNASATLIASFQKKSPVRSGPATPVKSAAGTVTPTGSNAPPAPAPSPATRPPTPAPPVPAAQPATPTKK